MSVRSIDKDYDALTVTALAEFEAGPEKVWELWADPRKLEGWWGPPTYPATVSEHSLIPGGSVTYFMTGPDGKTYHGWWAVQQVDTPKVPDGRAAGGRLGKSAVQLPAGRKVSRPGAAPQRAGLP
ncbi:SRPBCC domain-containing protein [Arthrobacter gandavensis]|uniref:SRPBCC family protein n=1 Tax=Arthrobacter gandavensis TaxID=169960 RepID=UPI00188DD496|nr:SRPBCC domain-containing protein [Arthrobacter gandavensis]MBF4992786.1 SRPBCC domain-containing protein [Arthrobacter gandavensis]